ncbi:hypothetical protein BDQ12DRAFT_684350 [Crucibulum laeve]|uniref:Uncharacterized protein n=1 Tax=Crucibulum laeve TaxID=68775 RepID=A0A5C3LYA2_9AGAR|nr:hypothetical protein BDQ12DRAFT_684350 [Crucibulum laeve]
MYNLSTSCHIISHPNFLFFLTMTGLLNSSIPTSTDTSFPLFCNEYINHGLAFTSNTPLSKHQSSNKCRLKLADNILNYIKLNDLTIQQLLCTHSTPQSPPNCEGVEISWELGYPNCTYPFSLHDQRCRSKPGYNVISVNDNDSTICVKSHKCIGVAPSLSVTCSSCQAVMSRVQWVREHAAKPAAHLNRTTLSLDQLGRG